MSGGTYKKESKMQKRRRSIDGLRCFSSAAVNLRLVPFYERPLK